MKATRKARGHGKRRKGRWGPFLPATLPPPETGLKADECWLNEVYQVLINWFDAPGPRGGRGMRWLCIKRRDRKPIHDWRELQAIKTELCGPEAEAVELYPAESRVVDAANQYHLFVLPEGERMPFGFTKRHVSDRTGGGVKQRPFAAHVRPEDVEHG